MNAGQAIPNCLLQAWHAYERELLGWLTRQLADRAAAEDVLQEVFIKALRQGQRFCDITNARAWLFEVTRNAVADQLRRKRETVELPDDWITQEDSPPVVDSLASCLPRVLAELCVADREAIICCDLQGMNQQVFASQAGLSLSAAKSRIQRARQRLRQRLAKDCQVSFDEAGRVCCFVPRPPLPEFWNEIAHG